MTNGMQRLAQQDTCLCVFLTCPLCTLNEKNLEQRSNLNELNRGRWPPFDNKIRLILLKKPSDGYTLLNAGS